MDNEFSFEITNESKNAINEILKQQGLRHFKLYTDFYGELDVINYEEYQKLEKEKDKEIERLKAREEEISKMCLANHKYASEMEGKYILAKYVIDELEKDLLEKQEFYRNELLNNDRK